jgi:hypothetical protein
MTHQLCASHLYAVFLGAAAAHAAAAAALHGVTQGLLPLAQAATALNQLIAVTSAAMQFQASTIKGAGLPPVQIGAHFERSRWP